jgi:protoheme IX farnesyltransferase
MATERVLAARHGSVVRDVSASPSTLSDYWALTKPDVNLVVIITTAAGFGLGLPPELAPFPWLRLLHTVAGTALVAGGAAALNQWLERSFDARMRRTARRPVAAGRVEPVRALAFGAAASVAGLAELAFGAGLLPSLLALGTLLSYLLIYTPLKRVTPLCTLAGAVPGAVPPLIGYAAARGRLDLEAWVLFAIVFLWQFPHVMAIAWMYRDDYDRAGYRVLPGGEARDGFVVHQTLLPLVALVVASVLPALTGEASATYAIGALVLSLGFVDCGTRFVVRRTGSAARQLLLASIVYLPVLFALMLLCRLLPRV